MHLLQEVKENMALQWELRVSGHLENNLKKYGKSYEVFKKIYHMCLQNIIFHN